MSKFSFTARDGQGIASAGVLEADSVAAVSAMLRESGKFPTAITPVDDAAPPARLVISNRGLRINRRELIQFSTQLAIMVDTGVTLSDALDCIAQQADRPVYKALITDLLETVRSGTDFSTALARHPRSFPQLYIVLMKASERSGMMGKMLVRATNYLRDEQDIVRRVKGALTYPCILLTFAVTMTVGLLAFVLPKFTAIYAAKAATLPMPTKILMVISNFLVTHYISVPAIVIGLVTAGVYYVRTPGGKRTVDYLQLHTPAIGGLFRKMHLSRGLRMVGTMAGAGVTLVECVNTARDLCSNGYFRDMWDRVLEQIKAGKQMSEPLFASRLIPRSVAQMIHSAERSGKLSTVMEQVAGFSEDELKETVTELTRYIEPAMIIVMGAIVGGIALAMLLPIFTISKVLH